MGQVLTSTIPLTLTARLGGGELDPDAGLVYDGDGRFFDPALGLSLQPDPFGGAPEAPASLNRYAALGVSTLPTLGSIPTRNAGRNYWDFVVELGSTSLNKITGYFAENRWTPAILSSLRLSTFGKTIARDHFVHLSVSWGFKP